MLGVAPTLTFMSYQLRELAALVYDARPHDSLFFYCT